MRILLDECLPARLCRDLSGHEVQTVPRAGWAGVKNGSLLRLIADSGKFDIFLTMDQNLEFQQNLLTLPIAVLVIEAVSNRIEHLIPLVLNILRELDHISPRSLRRVGG